MMDPLFQVGVITQTPNVQTAVWAGMHQDYSEAFVLDEPFPSETAAGEIAVRRLLASALCHLPVALWIQAQPLLGLLMIPKSLAYLAIGLIVYRRLPSMAPISSR